VNNTNPYIINILIESDDDELFWWVEKGLRVNGDNIFMNMDELSPSHLNNPKKYENLKERISLMNREKNLKDLE